MLILAADTTGSVCSAALSEDGRIIAESMLDHHKTHSEYLMPLLDFVLKSAGRQIGEVDVFASVVGPGSYTGIRIGVAAMKAFAHAGGKPCAAVNTLDSLARNVAPFEGIVCPLIDARRQEAYAALYQAGLRQSAYFKLPLTEILSRIRGQKTCFLGDGAIVYRELIAGAMGECAVFVEPNNCLQRASSACLIAQEAAMRGSLCTAFELEPFYLTKMQG